MTVQAMTKSKFTERQGTLKQNEPMSKHTSWRVGGPAEYYYQPASLVDLQNYLRSLEKNMAITWIGLGSNLLVRDGGIDGVVINVSGILNSIEFTSANEIYCETGVASPKLARQSVKNNLAGLEFLCGIPGSIGGALAMNAGAMGNETWDYVTEVTTIDHAGELHVRNKNEFHVAYRTVKSDFNEYFIAARFVLDDGERKVSEQKMKDYLARRASTQPTQMPNAGSVFRNPENDYAARLIEQCGLKGYCIGGASVSEKHANFIVNTGTATANDIESLINFVKNEVKQQMNIELQTEVKIIGNEK